MYFVFAYQYHERKRKVKIFYSPLINRLKYKEYRTQFWKGKLKVLTSFDFYLQIIFGLIVGEKDTIEYKTFTIISLFYIITYSNIFDDSVGCSSPDFMFNKSIQNSFESRTKLLRRSAYLEVIIYRDKNTAFISVSLSTLIRFFFKKY